MDLRHLSTFQAACRAGSFLGAARALGLTQPIATPNVAANQPGAVTQAKRVMMAARTPVHTTASIAACQAPESTISRNGMYEPAIIR